MKPSVRDHFISQFLLAGFTSDGTQDGTIYCFDLKNKSSRIDKTRNIGLEKHFNDLNVPDVPIDDLESKLSGIERQIASTFAELRRTKKLPNGIELDKILNFIALLIVRNPVIRRAVDDAMTKKYFEYLETQLASKESWDRFIAKTISSGLTILSDLSYEEAKQKLLPRTIKLGGEPTSYHLLEFIKGNEVLQLLTLRFWEVVLTSPGQPFITSDQPVTKYWTAPSPPPEDADGLESQHSAILFPVSADLLLLGTFRNDEYSSNPALRSSPMVNNLILTQTDRFAYSITSSFPILASDQKIHSSNEYFS